MHDCICVCVCFSVNRITNTHAHKQTPVRSFSCTTPMKPRWKFILCVKKLFRFVFGSFSHSISVCACVCTIVFFTCFLLLSVQIYVYGALWLVHSTLMRWWWMEKWKISNIHFDSYTRNEVYKTEIACTQWPCVLDFLSPCVCMETVSIEANLICFFSLFSFFGSKIFRCTIFPLN